MKYGTKIFMLMKVNPAPFFLYSAAALLLDLLTVLSAVCLQRAFNAFSSQDRISGNIYLAVLLLVAVYAGRGITVLLTAVFESYGGFSSDAILKLHMTERIFNAYGSKYADQADGEILNIFKNDIGQISQFLLSISEAFAAVFYMTIIFFILLRIHPLLLLIVTALALCAVLIVRIGFSKLAIYRKQAREAEAKVSAFAGEILSSALAVKMAGKQEAVLEYFTSQNREWAKMSVYESLLRKLMNSSSQFTFQLGEGVVLLVSFQMIRSGSFTVGDFVLFTFLIDSIMIIIQIFGDFISKIPLIKVAMDRMDALIQNYECVAPTKRDNLKSIDDIYKRRKVMKPQKAGKKSLEPFCSLELRNVCCTADSGQKMLEDINLKINQGTITVVCGRTASGKTALGRVVLGLYPMEQGELVWNGIKIKDPGKYMIPPVAAYTPQSPNFFSGSIRSNILLDHSIDDVILAQAIYRSVLEDDLKTMETGMDTALGNRGSGVSGGQQKRIALARMYAADAQIYVIDDISSAIDIETEKKLWNRIKEQKDKTFLIISNSRFAFEIADRIVLLDRGRIESQGTLEEILKKSKQMKGLYGCY